MTNLKSYFEGRIKKITELEGDSYTNFKEKFAEMLRVLSLGEGLTKEFSTKSVDFVNLNHYSRFALPFNLLKESISEFLNDEGQRRVNELSSQRKSTFFGEPELQTFVKQLPEKVKEPQPEEPMDLASFFQGNYIKKPGC
ncbi:hypothetical protein [Legionella parisiensis]|uniref:Uncharacterized protein n=1 Tax=Legionella parisiensis TaxID=45071 RepID=A0A1E5JVY2_9GAMM|nr:hypothetical protein [Legionella parisiensis]KTD41263.1 hypothetical protein Lpar_2580 [Legionella parisiensis]OEH48694.1 hypothetical protein lpari_00303 [Legionella parisiensis]STX76437.1 Uncharacterised protein [Legionella parisiensis]